MTGSHVGATRDNYSLTKEAPNVSIGDMKLEKSSFGYFSLKKSASPDKAKSTVKNNIAYKIKPKINPPSGSHKAPNCVLPTYSHALQQFLFEFVLFPHF